MKLKGIFFPGQECPQWLQKVSGAKMTFSSVCLVVEKGDRYCVYNLIGNVVFTIKGGVAVVVEGQSPPGKSGGVYIYTGSSMSWWTLVAIGVVLGLTLVP